ncbi:50S ribosomal protein P1 [archaeon]|jgi:large subunit ribosomal protein L12|nr:50S ribosomal protein P1 [archaeon]
MEYVYAALLLHKLGQEVTEDNLKKVISATGADVDESKVKVLVASLTGVDIDDKLANASVAMAAPAAGAAPAGDAPKVEEKKKEEPKAEAAEGLASLFG